jgi:hypothetical protein
VREVTGNLMEAISSGCGTLLSCSTHKDVNNYINITVTETLWRTFSESRWQCGLQLLYCWGHGFEFVWGNGCSSLVLVVCCVGSGLDSATCWSLVQRIFVLCGFVCGCVCVCVCACDLETSTTRWPIPSLNVAAQKE